MDAKYKQLKHEIKQYEIFYKQYLHSDVLHHGFESNRCGKTISTVIVPKQWWNKCVLKYNQRQFDDGDLNIPYTGDSKWDRWNTEIKNGFCPKKFVHSKIFGTDNVICKTANGRRYNKPSKYHIKYSAQTYKVTLITFWEWSTEQNSKFWNEWNQ